MTFKTFPSYLKTPCREVSGIIIVSASSRMGIIKLSILKCSVFAPDLDRYRLAEADMIFAVKSIN